jgi:hypothetical protein
MRWLWLVGLLGCSGNNDSDGSAPGDDDDDDVSTDLTPWEELVTSQADGCCHTVKEVFEWTTVDHEGLPATWAVPENPVGAVVVFHGTNGVMDTIKQTDWIELYNLLYPRGIAIIGTVSSDRDAKQWDLSEGNSNVDYPRVETLLARVADETAFDLDLPLVGVGFSQGCSFTTLFAELGVQKGRNVVGISMHSGGGAGADMPTLFVAPENDPAAARMPAAAADHPEGTLIVGTEEAIDPRWFGKLVSYTPEDSERIFDQLVDMEVIDADGVRTIAFESDGENEVVAIENALSVPYAGDVATQLRVLWALHRFSAPHNLEEAEWIETQIRD